MTFALILLAVFISLAAVCSCGKIEVQECSGIPNEVSDVEVDISDCSSGNNCTLYKGNIYYLTTTFTPKENLTSVKMRTLGVMGILHVPYIGPSLVCPEVTTEDGENCDPAVGLIAGKSYTHVKEFPVRRMYPEISIKARVEYRYKRSFARTKTFFCFEIPIKIESPPDDESDVGAT